MASLTDQYIAIAGQPIYLDVDAKVHAFLNSWFDPRMLDVVFNVRTRFHGDESYSEPSVFDSPYPDLPDLCINQYQIPTGLSRYARGLFLVDKNAMAKIAVQAFKGESVSDDVTDAQLKVIYPQLYTQDLETQTIEWGVETKQVLLEFNLENSFTDNVYVLRPIRVPFESRDLWLLPVADYRYKSQLEVKSKTDKEQTYPGNPTTWKEYVDWAWGYVTSSPNKDLFVSSYFGCPDPSILNSRKPLVNTIDAMALTIGYRYVPKYGLMDIDAAAVGREKMLSSDLIICGGGSGQCDLPEKIRIYAKKVRDWFGGYDWSRLSYGDAVNAFPDLYEYQLKNTAWAPDSGEPKGHSISLVSAWNVNIPTSPGSSLSNEEIFMLFAREFRDKWMPWVLESTDTTYFGVPKPYESGGVQNILTGYDNWAIIDLGFGPDGQDRITTRIQSLPNSWYPKCLIAQDKEDMTHDGPALFVSEADIPRATEISSTEWKVGQGRAYFMVLKPDGASWRMKKTTVYANVHNTLGSSKARANWPMQAKFIDGIWCIDVAECA
jgi:hypothetical protein